MDLVDVVTLLDVVVVALAVVFVLAFDVVVIFLDVLFVVATVVLLVRALFKRK